MLACRFKPGNRRLAPTALHRALCCASEFLYPDPLVLLSLLIAFPSSWFYALSSKQAIHFNATIVLAYTGSTLQKSNTHAQLLPGAALVGPSEGGVPLYLSLIKSVQKICTTSEMESCLQTNSFTNPLPQKRRLGGGNEMRQISEDSISGQSPQGSLCERSSSTIFEFEDVISK